MSCYYSSASKEQVDLFKTEKVRCHLFIELTSQLPGHLQSLEKWLATRCDGGFLLGELTFVDFYFAEHLDQLRIVFPDVLPNFPALSSYLDKFLALPSMVSFRSSKYFLEGPINNKMAFVNN